MEFLYIVFGVYLHSQNSDFNHVYQAFHRIPNAYDHCLS